MFRRASLPLARRFASSSTPTTEAPSKGVEALRQRLANDDLDFGDFAASRSDNDYSERAPKLRERRRVPMPEWLKRTAQVPQGQNYVGIKKKLRKLGLSTVCEEARCPNIGECWSGKGGHPATATIMLMGDTCTRACRFCAVKTSNTPAPLDPLEPEKTAEAVAEWGIGYVVLTSVDRDDLPDHGAAHLAETIRALKRRAPDLLVEALVPDFGGNLDGVKTVSDSGLDVYAHNIETVERLTPTVRDRRAGYKQTLLSLEAAKSFGGAALTKTSIMMGLGERPEEIEQCLQDLRNVGCDVVTFGQYMRPTKGHLAVEEYIHPDAFAMWKLRAEELGFEYAAAGPVVRSSYRAGEFFLENKIRKAKEAKAKAELEAAKAA